MIGRRADVWLGLVLLAFCSVAGWWTLRIPSVGTGTAAGPSFIPWIMIVGIAILSVAMMLRALLRAEPAAEEGQGVSSRATLLRLGVFVVLLVAYAGLFLSVGYLTTTIVVFIAGMFVLGERNWLFLIVLPAALTGAIYFVFTQFLGVWLP